MKPRKPFRLEKGCLVEVHTPHLNGKVEDVAVFEVEGAEQSEATISLQVREVSTEVLPIKRKKSGIVQLPEAHPGGPRYLAREKDLAKA